MSRLFLFCCSLTAVAVTEPVGDRCERAAATYSQLNVQLESCLPAGERPMAVELTACHATVDHCSSADQRAIDGFLGCIAQLPRCEAGALSNWRAQYEACAAGVQ